MTSSLVIIPTTLCSSSLKINFRFVLTYITTIIIQPLSHYCHLKDTIKKAEIPNIEINEYLCSILQDLPFRLNHSIVMKTIYYIPFFAPNNKPQFALQAVAYYNNSLVSCHILTSSVSQPVLFLRHPPRSLCCLSHVLL